MAYTYTEQDNGELLVENSAKGVCQTVPAIPRPYFLVYLPTNGNVYGVRDLADFQGQPIEFIKVVE